MKAQKIIGIKTRIGYFVSRLGDSNYKRFQDLSSLIVDGKHPEETYHEGWSLIQGEPVKIQKSVRQPNINHRFVLRDDVEFVDTDKLPAEMPRSEVMDEIDGACEWKEEYRHLSSLYTLVSDPQPDTLEDIEFEYRTICEVDEVKPNGEFKYKVQRTQWSHEGTTFLNHKAVINQLIDRIAFPPPVLPSKPSALSSFDTYRIIREHVKANIDPRYARVTSDHSFCFAVAKIVPLAKQRLVKHEIKNAKGRSYKKPRYRQDTVKSRKIGNVFEMTQDRDNYEGYTAIKGFEGKSHEDLKQNIDKFLGDLMARINEPLVDCPHCDGMGVIVPNTGKPE